MQQSHPLHWHGFLFLGLLDAGFAWARSVSSGFVAVAEVVGAACPKRRCRRVCTGSLADGDVGSNPAVEEHVEDDGDDDDDDDDDVADDDDDDGRGRLEPEVPGGDCVFGLLGSGTALCGGDWSGLPVIRP